MSPIDEIRIAQRNARIHRLTYLFHRLHEGKPFFYPVECWNDADALVHVECNPGTIKVTTPDGRVVWSQP